MAQAREYSVVSLVRLWRAAFAATIMGVAWGAHALDLNESPLLSNSYEASVAAVKSLKPSLIKVDEAPQCLNEFSKMLAISPPNFEVMSEKPSLVGLIGKKETDQLVSTTYLFPHAVTSHERFLHQLQANGNQLFGQDLRWLDGVGAHHEISGAFRTSADNGYVLLMKPAGDMNQDFSSISIFIDGYEWLATKSINIDCDPNSSK